MLGSDKSRRLNGSLIEIANEVALCLANGLVGPSEVGVRIAIISSVSSCCNELNVVFKKRLCGECGSLLSREVVMGAEIGVVLSAGTFTRNDNVGWGLGRLGGCASETPLSARSVVGAVMAVLGGSSSCRMRFFGLSESAEKICIEQIKQK